MWGNPMAISRLSLERNLPKKYKTLVKLLKQVREGDTSAIINVMLLLVDPNMTQEEQTSTINRAVHEVFPNVLGHKKWSSYELVKFLKKYNAKTTPSATPKKIQEGRKRPFVVKKSKKLVDEYKGYNPHAKIESKDGQMGSAFWRENPKEINSMFIKTINKLRLKKVKGVVVGKNYVVSALCNSIFGREAYPYLHQAKDDADLIKRIQKLVNTYINHKKNERIAENDYDGGLSRSLGKNRLGKIFSKLDVLYKYGESMASLDDKINRKIRDTTQIIKELDKYEERNEDTLNDSDKKIIYSMIFDLTKKLKILRTGGPNATKIIGKIPDLEDFNEYLKLGRKQVDWLIDDVGTYISANLINGGLKYVIEDAGRVAAKLKAKKPKPYAKYANPILRVYLREKLNKAKEKSKSDAATMFFLKDCKDASCISKKAKSVMALSNMIMAVATKPPVIYPSKSVGTQSSNTATRGTQPTTNMDSAMLPVFRLAQYAKNEMNKSKKSPLTILLDVIEKAKELKVPASVLGVMFRRILPNTKYNLKDNMIVPGTITVGPLNTYKQLKDVINKYGILHDRIKSEINEFNFPNATTGIQDSSTKSNISQMWNGMSVDQRFAVVYMFKYVLKIPNDGLEAYLSGSMNAKKLAYTMNVIRFLPGTYPLLFADSTGGLMMSIDESSTRFASRLFISFIQEAIIKGVFTPLDVRAGKGSTLYSLVAKEFQSYILQAIYDPTNGLNVDNAGRLKMSNGNSYKNMMETTNGLMRLKTGVPLYNSNGSQNMSSNPINISGHFSVSVIPGPYPFMYNSSGLQVSTLTSPEQAKALLTKRLVDILIFGTPSMGYQANLPSIPPRFSVASVSGSLRHGHIGGSTTYYHTGSENLGSGSVDIGRYGPTSSVSGDVSIYTPTSINYHMLPSNILSGMPPELFNRSNQGVNGGSPNNYGFPDQQSGNSGTNTPNTSIVSGLTNGNLANPAFSSANEGYGRYFNFSTEQANAGGFTGSSVVVANIKGDNKGLTYADVLERVENKGNGSIIISRGENNSFYADLYIHEGENWEKASTMRLTKEMVASIYGTNVRQNGSVQTLGAEATAISLGKNFQAGAGVILLFGGNVNNVTATWAKLKGTNFGIKGAVSGEGQKLKDRQNIGASGGVKLFGGLLRTTVVVNRSPSKMFFTQNNYLYSVKKGKNNDGSPSFAVTNLSGTIENDPYLSPLTEQQNKRLERWWDTTKAIHSLTEYIKGIGGNSSAYGNVGFSFIPGTKGFNVNSLINLEKRKWNLGIAGYTSRMSPIQRMALQLQQNMLEYLSPEYLSALLLNSSTSDVDNKTTDGGGAVLLNVRKYIIGIFKVSIMHLLTKYKNDAKGNPNLEGMTWETFSGAVQIMEKSFNRMFGINLDLKMAGSYQKWKSEGLNPIDLVDMGFGIIINNKTGYISWVKSVGAVYFQNKNKTDKTFAGMGYVHLGQNGWSLELLGGKFPGTYYSDNYKSKGGYGGGFQIKFNIGKTSVVVGFTSSSAKHADVNGWAGFYNKKGGLVVSGNTGRYSTYSLLGEGKTNNPFIKYYTLESLGWFNLGGTHLNGKLSLVAGTHLEWVKGEGSGQQFNLGVNWVKKTALTSHGLNLGAFVAHSSYTDPFWRVGLGTTYNYKSPTSNWTLGAQMYYENLQPNNKDGTESNKQHSGGGFQVIFKYLW